VQTALGKVAQMICQARKTVAMTGAGISVESGIPDFRSPGGLWDRFDPMEYGTIEAFRADPKKVFVGHCAEIVNDEWPRLYVLYVAIETIVIVYIILIR